MLESYIWGTGEQVMSVLVISILTNVVAAGRSVPSHDALCVEVLKTSAGLGLSLDGGKSSMAGDGPLFIKRVYKGNALEKPVSCLFSVYDCAFHLENVFILSHIQGVLCVSPVVFYM